MPVISQSFTFDLESNMRIVAAREYERLEANLYWQRVAKEMPTQAKKERISWLLDSAKIQYVNRLGGEVDFEDIVSQTTEFQYQAATAGLTLNRFQLEDHDGNGVQLAAHWARQMGAYAAYWPQKQIAKTINAGEVATSLAYDGVTFFNASHPVNPWDASAGNYANVFTGVASGSYPGALPIDSSVTVDVAINNVGKALAYILGAVKMPNGEDPRMLRPRAIMGPASLTTRIQQITNAKYIAQAAAAGGGGADIEAVIRNWGFDMPIEAPELGAGFTNGSDTSWYLLMSDITTDDLGALVYVNREPFSIVYHDGVSDADLARVNNLQWITRGANTVGYGHPYLLFKVKAT